MRPHPLPVMAVAANDFAVAPEPASPALKRQVEDQLAARHLVARLREHLARLEDSQHKQRPRPQWQDRSARGIKRWGLGVPSVDTHLPEQGLARYGLHDVAPVKYGDNAAAMGFALALAMNRLKIDRRERPLLWCRSAIECREHGKLYGHGGEQLGLPRSKLLTVMLKRPVSLFWTMEEALKSGCFACVITDAASQQTDLTVTRRLSLSAGDGHSAGLLVFNRNHDMSTASFSRWQVASITSSAPPWERQAPGNPAWAVTLSRIRSGKPGQWPLTWQSNQPQIQSDRLDTNYASHHFHLLSGLSGGALSQGATETWRGDTTQGPALRTG
jgi:protein ImuA